MAASKYILEQGSKLFEKEKALKKARARKKKAKEKDKKVKKIGANQKAKMRRQKRLDALNKIDKEMGNDIAGTITDNKTGKTRKLRTKRILKEDF